MANGNISEVDESLLQPGGTTTQTNTIKYQYDALNRLTVEALTSSDASLDQTTNYTLDQVGNRVKEVITTPSQTEIVTSQYDARDRLLSSSDSIKGTTSFGYDVNGNLTGQTNPDGSTVTYTFDLRGRMVQATAKTSAGGVLYTESLTFNPDGIRTGSTLTQNGTTTTNRYLIDGLNPTGLSQVLEVLSSTGAFVASYVQGLQGPISQLQGGQSSYYLVDGHSGVRQLLTTSGAVANTYLYSAYGSLLFSAGSISNLLLYRGQWFDPILQQYDLRARFYDPFTGQFTAMDPAAWTYRDPLQINRYEYAGFDPINNIDPSGLSFENDLRLQGIIADWAFRIWAKGQRPWTTPGLELGTILPALFPASSKEASLKPDLLDTQSQEYFDLKPARHKGNLDLQRDDNNQMEKYGKALQPYGYHRGDSFQLVPQQPGGLLIGVIITPTKEYTVRLWPADQVMQPSGLSGEGIVWYSVREIKRDPPIIPVAAKERTEKYQGEPITIRVWQPQDAPIAAAALTITALVGAGIAAQQAGWSLQEAGAFTTSLLLGF